MRLATGRGLGDAMFEFVRRVGIGQDLGVPIKGARLNLTSQSQSKGAVLNFRQDAKLLNISKH